jgi:hypothetical protein
METKQTAVEFLLKNLAENFENEMQSIYSKNTNLLASICIEAKEMEKQQIVDFGNDLLAQNDKNYIAMPDLAEQYYNETYNN